MKPVIFIILLFVCFVSGCSSAATESNIRAQRLSVQAETDVPKHNRIVLLTVPGDVQRGDMANLEIQGISGISYTAVATYRVNYEKKTVYKTIVAPKSGIVTWNFKIESNTMPGVYPISISGGGQEINTSYRVIE